jgi:hypothetical protein
MDLAWWCLFALEVLGFFWLITLGVLYVRLWREMRRTHPGRRGRESDQLPKP